MRSIGIGLVGFGNIGSALVETLNREGDRIARASGVPLALVRVGDRNPGRNRHLLKAPGILTTDLQRVVTDPRVDIVVELIGGVPHARRVVMGALKAGKHVVTANKHLLSEHGGEIVKAASRRHLLVGFEAAVCGGVPLI